MLVPFLETVMGAVVGTPDVLIGLVNWIDMCDPLAFVYALTNRAGPVWPSPVADQRPGPMAFSAATCASQLAPCSSPVMVVVTAVPSCGCSVQAVSPLRR